MADPKDDNKIAKHLKTAGQVAQAADSAANATSGFATGIHHFVQAVQGDKGAQKDVGSQLVKGIVPLAVGIAGAVIAAVASQKAGDSNSKIAKNAAGGAMKMQGGGVTNLVAAIVGPIIQIAVDPAVMIAQKANELIKDKTGKDVVGKLTGITSTTATVTQGAADATKMAKSAHGMVSGFVDKQEKKKVDKKQIDPVDAASVTRPTFTPGLETQIQQKKDTKTAQSEPSTAPKPTRPGSSSNSH